MEQRRKPIRLRHFDYGNTGAYFVTICTHQRKRFLSRIEEGLVQLTVYGDIVEEELQRTADMRDNISLGDYVLMPDHLHLILYFEDRTAKRLPESPTDPLRSFGGSHGGSLSSIIGNFKSAATSRIRKSANRPKANIWQRGFYEHIIRNEKELMRIREYILGNPGRWAARGEGTRGVPLHEGSRHETSQLPDSHE